MPTIKGGKYALTAGVVFIFSDNTDDTNSNSNKAMIIASASNSEGNNSNNAIT